MLTRFATVSGRQIIFRMEKVRGELTNAVAGEFSAPEALGRMLAGTALVAQHDQATGAFVISRPPRDGEGPAPAKQKPKRNAGKGSLAAVAGWLALALGPSPSGVAADAAVGVVEGRVYNALNSEYLNNARVTLEGTTREVQTNSFGEFRFDQVPAGPTNVRVSVAGYAPTTVSAVVTPGVPATVSIGLKLERVRAGAPTTRSCWMALSWPPSAR